MVRSSSRFAPPFVPLIAGAFALSLCVVGSIRAGEPEPAADDEALRVMSFNIRTGAARDGENAWPRRKDFVAETVLAFAPDVLGTQETHGFQRDDLSKRLPGYAAFGVGRDDGREGGEMMAVFYRTDRLKKLDGGHFWLSETPDEPGSKSWDSSLPRLCTWLKLEDRRADGAGVFWLFNTHFDHRGRRARANSATLLREKIAAIAGDGPAILTGDFNASPGGEPYRNLFGEAGGGATLRDSYQERHPDEVRGDNLGTAGGFRREDRGESRIDWIAVTPGWTILDAAIDRTNRDGRTPSDHDPVTAILQRDRTAAAPGE